MEIITNIRAWILQQYALISSPSYRFKVVSDTPEIISNKIVFVVMEEAIADALVFKCPCGCNEDIYLNLLPDARPSWTWTSSSRRKITIYPSVWRKVGCKSHFFIRKGKIIWCH